MSTPTVFRDGIRDIETPSDTLADDGLLALIPGYAGDPFTPLQALNHRGDFHYCLAVGDLTVDGKIHTMKYESGAWTYLGAPFAIADVLPNVNSLPGNQTFAIQDLRFGGFVSDGTDIYVVALCLVDVYDQGYPPSGGSSSSSPLAPYSLGPNYLPAIGTPCGTYDTPGFRAFGGSQWWLVCKRFNGSGWVNHGIDPAQFWNGGLSASAGDPVLYSCVLGTCNFEGGTIAQNSFSGAGGAALVFGACASAAQPGVVYGAWWEWGAVSDTPDAFGLTDCETFFVAVNPFWTPTCGCCSEFHTHNEDINLINWVKEYRSEGRFAIFSGASLAATTPYAPTSADDPGADACLLDPGTCGFFQCLGFVSTGAFTGTCPPQAGPAEGNGTGAVVTSYPFPTAVANGSATPIAVAIDATIIPPTYAVYDMNDAAILTAANPIPGLVNFLGPAYPTPPDQILISERIIWSQADGLYYAPFRWNFTGGGGILTPATKVATLTGNGMTWGLLTRGGVDVSDVYNGATTFGDTTALGGYFGGLDPEGIVLLSVEAGEGDIWAIAPRLIGVVAWIPCPNGALADGWHVTQVSPPLTNSTTSDILPGYFPPGTPPGPVVPPYPAAVSGWGGGVRVGNLLFVVADASESGPYAGGAGTYPFGNPRVYTFDICRLCDPTCTQPSGFLHFANKVTW